MASPAPLQPLARRMRILRRQSLPVHPSLPRPQRRDCHGRLASALLALAGEGAALDSKGMKPWCSATFVGASHHFILTMPGKAADIQALAAMLEEHEFRIPGHIVADVGAEIVQAADGSAALELHLLTIEDW